MRQKSCLIRNWVRTCLSSFHTQAQVLKNKRQKKDERGESKIRGLRSERWVYTYTNVIDVMGMEISQVNMLDNYKRGWQL